MKLTTKTLSIEQTITELNSKQEKLKEITQKLLWLSMLYTEGSGYLGKTPEIYEKEIDKTLESLSSYLPPNIIKNMKDEIKQLEIKVQRYALLPSDLYYKEYQVG